MLLRAGVLLAAAVAFFSAGPLAANAQDYPSRPIKLLIHTPPGSLVDVLGRLVGQELGERLGQSLIIDNRVGGATMIAVEQLKNSPADGYTLMINTSEATMLPFLKKSYRTDPIKDFTPIALVVTSWTVFAVNPKVPANTLPELVAYSKSHPAACATARAAPAACCTSRSRCSSSRAAAISSTCRIAAARRPRPMRSRARSRWCRWGLRRRASPKAGSSRFWRRPVRAGIRCCQTCRPQPRPAMPTCAWTPGSVWSGRRACRRRSSRGSTKSLPVIAKQPAFQDKLVKLGIGGGLQAWTQSSSRSWPTTPRSGAN